MSFLPEIGALGEEAVAGAEIAAEAGAEEAALAAEAEAAASARLERRAASEVGKEDAAANQPGSSAMVPASFGVDTHIALLGAGHAIRTLDGIAGRLENARPALQPQLRRLEASEREVFASAGGKYVRTGRLRNSLTLPMASDGIRRVTGRDLEFGTRVDYARYQVENPGPPTGHRGGLRRRGHPSAVLKLNSLTAHEIARDVLGRVVSNKP